MGAVIFISMGLAILMAVPILTSFHAKHLGRNQKLWFFIGLILPGIATIILSFLPDLSEEESTKLPNSARE
ncbi:MAG: hypothetical protein SFY56_05280 [Bacteroidota bacterium]|nr:hypothetical protein [Bacteroidota bacterium]